MTSSTTSRRRWNGTRPYVGRALVLALGLLLTGPAGVARPEAALRLASLAQGGPDDRDAQVPPVVAESRDGEALPATLQLAMTRRLAREAAREYRIAADGHGANPHHGLTLTFTPEGARVDGGNGGFALRVARIGRGGGEVVRPATPRIDGAWVEYDRGAGVREWFVNLPQGVEQGWTVTERLAGHGPLALTLDTGRPPDRMNDERLAWSGLVYHGLVARDAEGRELPAWWTSDGARLRIEVDDAAAVYPVVIDPWVQQAKLIAGDGSPFDFFGTSVALEGDTALVGTQPDTVFSDSPGAAYVFTRSGGVWSQQAKLVAADGAMGDFFGTSVALSGDTALVGALAADPAGSTNQGAAYVFTRSGGVWSQQAKLIAADGAVGDSFGKSVALSGGTALVGASGANDLQGGAAYVFTRSGEVWSQQAKLVAADGADGDRFGGSVALSGDIALVGAVYATGDNDPDQGAAYVFTRGDDGWSEQATLSAADGARRDEFGWSVALSGEGDTALVVAFGARAVYVFTRSGTQWSQPQKLTPEDVGEVIQSVALSDEGDTALVGATSYNNFWGAAYVFTRSGDVWSHEDTFTAYDGRDDYAFGWSVALAGGTALVGTHPAVEINADQGAAYVFEFQADTAAPTTTITLGPGTPTGEDPWYTSGVRVTVEAADDIGVAQIRCDLDPSESPGSFEDLPNEACAFAPPSNLADDGDHTLYAASIDDAGNAGEVVSARVPIDQTPPTVTCDTPAPTFALGQAGAVVTAEVTDETSGPAETPVSAAADTTSPGEHTVTLAGLDGAGNQTEVSCSYVVTVPSPTISGTVVDEDGEPVEGVTVELSGDDQAGMTTDEEGRFAFADLARGGRYTVTPTHADYHFTPESREFASLEEDAQALFTGTRLTADYTRYFGEGAIGPFFDTTFALFNPGDEDAAATLTFAGEASDVVPHTVIIPAGAQVVVDPETLLPADWVGFATAIYADQVLVTSRTMRWDDRHYGRHESAGVATPQTEWWFTEGATGTFQLFYLLYNPGDQAADVTATYYRGAEQAAVTRTYAVAPHTRRTVLVNVAADGVTPDPDLGTTDVAARIVSTNGVPIVAERAMYLTTEATQPFTAGTMAAAVTTAAESWHFAEGATDFFDLFLLLANPSTEPVEATVRYLLPTGEPLARTYTLEPESRRTIWVDAEDDRLAETQVAITVQSETPILAERAMWWGASGAWDGGHVSTGAVRPAARWGLAGLVLGGPAAAEAYVLVANPNNADAEATLTLITPDGVRHPVNVPLAPWSRTTLRLRDLFSDAGAAAVAVLVESTRGEDPVPLVVEGAAYASPDGQPLTTGSATPALPLPE
ncbi:MAG: hypothetical protein GEU99_14360 [Luteitalea sp.]|nr:hypothetical protein [Luteitalea sp.]